MIEIITAAIVAFIFSFSMMKFHMRMIERWMDRFFEEETRRMKEFIKENAK